MKMKHLQICISALLILCIPSILIAGMTSGHISRIQQKLVEQGYDPGPVDGIIGPKTVSAVKQFQKHKNLTVTGKLDDSTIAALGLQPPARARAQGQAGEARNTTKETSLPEPPERPQPEKSAFFAGGRDAYTTSRPMARKTWQSWLRRPPEPSLQCLYCR